MKEFKRKRNLTIDYLRFIALIGLLIAHTSENLFLLQIRSFDVNLLIIISAMLSSKNIFESKESVVNYYIKRFIRLVIPTWLFISFYFILNFVFKFESYTVKQIIKSYLLMKHSAVSYVWIIYIYMICAILLPFLLRIDIRRTKEKYLICFLLMIYFICHKISSNELYMMLILYPIIYGLVFLLGLNWDALNKNEKKILIVCNLLIFIILAIFHYQNNGIFVVTGKFKYPPQLYYLSYTIGISLLVIEIFRRISFKQNIITKYVVFVSKSSLWFYLWHILVMQIVQRITSHNLMRFLIVLLITSIILLIQDKVVKKLENNQKTRKYSLILKG